MTARRRNWPQDRPRTRPPAHDHDHSCERTLTQQDSVHRTRDRQRPQPTPHGARRVSSTAPRTRTGREAIRAKDARVWQYRRAAVGLAARVLGRQPPRVDLHGVGRPGIRVAARSPKLQTLIREVRENIRAPLFPGRFPAQPSSTARKEVPIASLRVVTPACCRSALSR
jgi:hypothetical protein